MFVHTRRRAFGAAGASLVTLAIIAGGGATSGQVPQRTPVAPVFNGVLFEEHVRGTHNGIVKGYAFAVADRNGAIQAKAAGGFLRLMST